MIKSFSSREAQKLYEQGYSKKLPFNIQRIALRKLYIIEAATSLSDLRIPPSNHLEKLIGNRNGKYSIRINKQWRICFVWRNGNAYDVEMIDYH